MRFANVFSRPYLGLGLLISAALIALPACGPENAETASSPQEVQTTTALDDYIALPDDTYGYEVVQVTKGDGFTQHVIRMTSQRWLTEAEVKDPVWWHWLTIVVPDQVESETGLLFIGGGSRDRDAPTSADEMLVQAAMATSTVVMNLHNVPNQPVEFVGDDYGPRVEDELIAYGWRRYMEGGAKEEDAIWLARLPMTKAAVRAMDTVTDYLGNYADMVVDSYVVAGGSKRGWTTWTTAAVDDRVVAIAPIVIDLLNVVPSFEHHWQAYGFWAPAVGNYQEEGIMEWQDTPEYDKLVSITEPYSYRDRLTMPKLIINATGDQFFLPDSWQFYWDGLQGEKHLRYVANGEHSLRGTDAMESLIAFHHSIVTDTPRPDVDWSVEGNTIQVQTAAGQSPTAITMWTASNTETRDFRVDTIGRTWESEEIPLSENGSYTLSLDPPASGWSAFFIELTYPGPGPIPIKVSTGVVVVPDVLPHPPFVSS